jgi:5-methylcytosine-specific restriction endonuclease McrA
VRDDRQKYCGSLSKKIGCSYLQVLERFEQYKKDHPEINTKDRTKYLKQYYLKNRRQILTRMKERQQLPEIKQQRNIYEKLWYSKNKEKYLEQRKEYVAKNKEVVAERGRAWYWRNKDRRAAKSKEWAKKNPEKMRIISHRRRARLLNAEGSFTQEDWLKLKEIYDFTCPKCFRSEPEIKLTMDHKVPLVKGGSNYLDNIQPLCVSCNTSKGKKIWFAFYPINYKPDVYRIFQNQKERGDAVSKASLPLNGAARNGGC